MLPLCGAQQPNIVLIVADDLGYGDLGCFGNAFNKTSHIDTLAADGLRFLDFHSAGPMCSPTRAAMLTGQYQQRFGREFDTALSGDYQHGLPHEAVTIAELLKSRGYATACFGKWHLGYRPPWLPTNQGFDVFRGLGSGDGDYHTHIDRSGNEDWWHNNQIEMVEGYTTDLLTQYSVEFIEANRERPFFLYVPHLAIHFPWQGPSDPGHRQKGNSYNQDKWGIIPDRSHVAPHVKAMLQSLDASTGKILETLEKWQLDGNTLLIFTSDNGGYINYAPDFEKISSNGQLRGQKTQLYEGGHRVPTIVRWPGKIQPGVTAATAHSIDILPTIAASVGIEHDHIETDGISLLPLLLEGHPLPERTLYWRAQAQSAVRSGPWKLYRDDKKTELYNLHDDLSEQHDLAAAHPELVGSLSRAWKAWETEVDSSSKKSKGNP
jgi:arylsulfatase A-like enzyme